MGAPYIPNPQKVSKYEKWLSYSSCDEMIKKSPTKIGLRMLELFDGGAQDQEGYGSRHVQVEA